MNAPALPRIGDLVIWREGTLRSRLRLPDEPGLVVEIRTGEAAIFLPSVFGRSWVPQHELARIRNPAESGLAPWMVRVHELASLLDAELLEVERFGPEGTAVRLFHGEVEVTRLDEVRHLLADDLRYYGLNPAGAHRIESSIAFVCSSPVSDARA